ncbi:GDSL-type esterase/lipase family protein [Kocuria nitroreducens]|uniref:GDSL-type esterase/lipase family protein n=1 Tax=Kocuria nitroreducens TaxID=3058914 RepID=UPI0036DF5839
MRPVSVRRTVTALVSALALASTAASPAAGAPRTIELVNLGDSFSAAFGTGGLQQVEGVDSCDQGTGRDHVDELGSHPRVEVTLDAACAGYTAQEVEDLVSTKPVREALATADVVTLTMGGNDIGWAEFIGTCSAAAEAESGPAPCDALLAQAPARIAAASSSAAETADAIGTESDARIVVLGYPNLFDDRQDSPLISAGRAAQLNDWTDELNAALAAAVAEEGAVFVDVTDRFRGHGVGSADPWILFAPEAGAHNLHPTERGYLCGYFPGLLSQVARTR